MIISESHEYDVTLKVSKDYKQSNIYMVIYGLQVKQFQEFDHALDEYNNCLKHAIGCNGIIGDFNYD